jgi:hypothetical protein
MSEAWNPCLQWHRLRSPDFEPFVLDVLRYVFALRNTKDAEGAQTFSTVFLKKYRFLKKDCAVFRGCIKKINEQSDRIVTLTHLE